MSAGHGEAQERSIDTLNDAIGKRAHELGAVLDGRTQQLAGAFGTRSSELSEA